MSETEASLYCPKCGGLNPPGAAVCFACGADMQAAAERPPASQNGLGLLKGRYRLRAQIGEGGFGAVYRAEDSQLGNRLVAVKEMRPAGLSPQEAQEATEAFHREAGLLAGLNHPSLPHIYEHFSENGRWYLVMEYIGGQSLEEQLKHAPLNRLPAREALYIAIQLCTVLEYLHGRVPPIIFRDLKPSNVMLTPEGQVYLIDFGIARHFKPGQSKDTMAFGSPGYAAPEQYGKAQTTPRSDVFSLGALLHQMLSGSDPANTPFRFANLSMPLPTGLNALIHRMVDLDEGKRPPSMAAVKRQLEDMAEAWGTPHTGKVTTALASHQKTATLAPATIGSAKTQGAPTIVPLQTKAPPPPKKKGGKRFGRLLIVAGIMVFFWARSCNQPRISTITDTFPVDTPTAALGIEGNVYAVAWSPDGNLIASARSTGVVNVWGASSGTTFLDYTGHSLAVYTLAWSPDGTEIASAGADGTVQVWDALTGTLNRTYRGHTDAVWAVAWSPDGKEIASGGLDGTVQVWNAVTGVTLLRYTGHNGYIYSVAWSPDRKYIASGGRDSSVQVWDAATGKTLYTYRGHTDKIWSVAWSPDGKRIASASDDGTVQVWDALTGDHVFVYHGDKIVVDALAWSPDGKNLATGGYDDLVQEWDAASGTPIKTYAGQGGTIWSVAWSSDGRRIASGSADGTVRVWDAGTGANALTYSGG